MANTGVLWEGWLEKQGKMRLEGYSRRYFVLTEQMFEYWAPPKSESHYTKVTEPLLRPALREEGFTRQGAISVPAVMSIDDQPGFNFIARTADRAYVLRAATLEEKQECVRALNRLLAQRQAMTRGESAGSLGRGASTSTVDSPAHDYEGWIFKRGQKIHAWRRRYAVLDGNVLRYYTQQTHARDRTAARGRIVIQSVVAVDGPKPSTYGFNIEATGRADIFYLYVLTEAERNAWIEAMRKSRGQNKRQDSAITLDQYESDEEESEASSVGVSSEVASTSTYNPFLREPRELPSVDEQKASTDFHRQPSPQLESEPAPQEAAANGPAPTLGRNAGQPVDMCGWLWKKGEIRQAWKRRYFTLQGKIIKYYEDEMAAAAEHGIKGEYEVVSAEAVHDPALFMMDIRTVEGRMLHTYTERIELRTRWLDAIRAVAGKSQRRPASMTHDDSKSSSFFASRVVGGVAQTFKSRKPPSPKNPKAASKSPRGHLMPRRAPIAAISEQAAKGGDFFGSDDDDDDDESDAESDDSTGTEGVIRMSLSNEQHHLAFACALLDSPDAKQVANGLAALTDLSMEDEICFAMQEEGILPIVINTMRAHSEDVAIQEQGLKLCVNLCYHDSLAALFVTHSGVHLVLDALNTHAKSANVQQQGLHVLKNLSASEAHRRIVLKEMGLSVVITAIKAHPRSAAVQEEGIGALANLATDGESTRLQMVQKGVLRLLEAAQAKHPPDSNVHEACSRFIANFGM